MADLEELGYLEQPHTSAGRIPSDKGYRLYVDRLMEINNPTREEIEVIKSILELTTMNEIEKIMKRTTKLLSQITRYTTAMLTPSVSKSTVKSIQLIQVTMNDVLAVIVTDTAMIKNVLIKLPRTITSSNLIKINNMLNDKLRGLTCEEIDLSVISSIQNEISGYYEILNAIIPVLHESLNSMEGDVYLEGATNIFNYPEYNDLDKARTFLSLMDQREVLGDIISEGEGKLAISIGNENEFQEMKDCSIIKATYSLGDRSIGKIGIIGPKRMNYSRVVGLLNCIVEILNEVLNNHLKE
jgi:heat-inducible transcriptional repressor